MPPHVSTQIKTTMTNTDNTQYKNTQYMQAVVCYKKSTTQSARIATYIVFKQDAHCSAIAERPRCRLHQFWPKVEDLNWETIFYGHYRSIFNHCDIIGLQSYEIRFKKRKIRANTPFEVIQGYRGRTDQKPVLDILLVINSN